MKTLLIILLMATAYGSQENTSKDSYEPCGWQKVFENDPDGNRVFGDKEKLVEAVRMGYAIRVGFGEKPIAHFADAKFLTVVDGNIIKGEVFAQLETIVGQMPAVENDSLKMRFRTWNHWTKIVGTTGYSTAIMTDYQKDTLVNGNRDQKAAVRWYAEYPCNTP